MISLEMWQLVVGILGTNTVSALALTLVSRKRDAFSGIVAAYGKLSERVVTLEQRLDAVDEDLRNERDGHRQTMTKLESEQNDHAHTREALSVERNAHAQTKIALNRQSELADQLKKMLRLATEHIRATIVWNVTERDQPMPVPPVELMVQT